MATTIDSRVLIAGGILATVIYLRSIRTAEGLGRTVKGGLSTGYSDIKSVYRTGYRDVARPVGRATKKVASKAWTAPRRATRFAGTTATRATSRTRKALGRLKFW